MRSLRPWLLDRENAGRAYCTTESGSLIEQMINKADRPRGPLFSPGDNRRPKPEACFEILSFDYPQRTEWNGVAQRMALIVNIPMAIQV